MSTKLSSIRRWLSNAYNGIPEPRILTIVLACVLGFVVGMIIGRAVYVALLMGV